MSFLLLIFIKWRKLANDYTLEERGGMIKSKWTG
jgi:hypothetical protein